MKKYICEFLGTLVLVLFACGVAAVTGCTSEANAAYILTALAFGLVIVAMAYSIGNVSGCHINPAVSLGMFVSGRMSLKDLVGYLVAQFAGGVAGAAILSALIDKNKLGLGANALYEGSVVKSLIVEAILTFVFVLSVLGVTSRVDNGKVAGLVIGGSLTLVHLFGIYFTGTSVNPARSLGPAIFMGGDALSSVWVFIVAPLAGGVLAALFYRLVAPEKD